MTKTAEQQVKAVRRYYRRLESILSYRLLRGVKHCGYHPDPNNPLSVAEAQVEQNDLIGRTLALPRGKTILECGCGEGSTANYLAQKYGYVITGVDILPRNIARANRQASTEGNQNTFQMADYMQLPFADNTFDGVYAMETLVHAADAHVLFTGMYRVLKPGGKLVFCEYSMTPRSKMSKAGKRTMTIINTACPMPALEQFTQGSFPALLHDAGFTSVTVTDITEHIKPSVVKFNSIARYPMAILSRLHLERYFVNTYCSWALYRSHVRGEDLMQYNLVTAYKPKT